MQPQQPLAPRRASSVGSNGTERSPYGWMYMHSLSSSPSQTNDRAQVRFVFICVILVFSVFFLLSCDSAGTDCLGSDQDSRLPQMTATDTHFTVVIQYARSSQPLIKSPECGLSRPLDEIYFIYPPKHKLVPKPTSAQRPPWVSRVHASPPTLPRYPLRLRHC